LHRKSLTCRLHRCSTTSACGTTFREDVFRFFKGTLGLPPNLTMILREQTQVIMRPGVHPSQCFRYNHMSLPKNYNVPKGHSDLYHVSALLVHWLKLYLDFLYRDVQLFRLLWLLRKIRRRACSISQTILRQTFSCKRATNYGGWKRNMFMVKGQ